MSRQNNLGGGIQHVLDYLKRMKAENPSFFYAIDAGSEHSSGNIFWADPSSRMNYNHFGDTVRFDTIYKMNRYKVPFAAFTGLNHHGQPILFGCALILNESDSSFIWILQTWLQAMAGRFPISITTETIPHIQIAVAQVLPQTCHRFCKWTIFKETREKLAHVYQTNLDFESEFMSCVDETDTVVEFESCWISLMERYYLLGNDWLQSIYNVRHQWVPLYVRGTFFGELSMGDSFFEGFVNANTTVQLLIKQYERAISSWHEKELKADYDTTNITEVLKTPSPMEKQAANLYTKRIFKKFQDELVETLANQASKIEESGSITVYKVCKFGEESKGCQVRFDSFEMQANCSCQMFEFSGIICRHILTIFRAKNVLTFPSAYLLKRWTRNARSGGDEEECELEIPSTSAQQDCSIDRYNNLRQESIKFIEVGAKSIHSYNVAMDALQEAAKKVAAAKRRMSDCSSDVTLANGSHQEGNASEDNTTDHIPCQSAIEKQRKIDELTAELDNTNRRCEVYRANLLGVLRDMEEQKLKLSVKVQNARLSLKEQ
ncbi:protein FAR1-RELATED SEQUENCE 9 [Impatiens glandulifera]|uniref:protein FAR1-RELATED SEQUENCE 9 n=1 Tax=Impatiens glandulifera TaxID=253017 RepID=UPI001FB0E371|nr:protein FAR1-RELATED SEQUENCE 9 [Impatiens glandulifera]